MRTFVLTHLVPAPQPGAEDEWIALAKEHFDGTVVVAKDLLSLEVVPIGVTRDPGPFREASGYYLAGRPPYSRELLPTLERELPLDGHGRLLDVGTGPGVLVVDLAPFFDEAVAVDPDPGMLAEGERRADAAGLRAIRWIQAAAEDLARTSTPAPTGS